jgi:hypothetical protein
MLPSGEIFLRIWTPKFVHMTPETPVEIVVRKARRFIPAPDRQVDPRSVDPSEQHVTLNAPFSFPDKCAYERVYAFPAELKLEARQVYSISGWILDQKKNVQIFEFPFHTDDLGLPLPF